MVEADGVIETEAACRQHSEEVDRSWLSRVRKGTIVQLGRICSHDARHILNVPGKVGDST